MTSEFPANKNNKICFTNACQCNDFVAVHLIKKTLKWSSFFCSYWWDTMGNKTRLSDIARFDDVYFTFNKLPRAKQFCQLSRQFYNIKAKQNWTTNIFRSICLFVCLFDFLLTCLFSSTNIKVQFKGLKGRKLFTYQAELIQAEFTSGPKITTTWYKSLR